MIFDIPFIADWKKIEEHRQRLTDPNTAYENEGTIDMISTRLVKKYLSGTTVYFAKQNPGI
jgi:hypothetical protein